MKVWYINLDRRTDRRKSIFENLKQMGVPESSIHRVCATDRDDFQTPDDLIQHAIDLGFPDFKTFWKKRWHFKYLGYMVSYVRCLDMISRQEENVLLMEDDYILRENFDKICESFNSLWDLREGVKFAMLTYSIPRGIPSEMVHYNRIANHYRDCEAVSAESEWQRGVPASGDDANIYTPYGASFLLKKCLLNLPKTCEVTIREMADAVIGVYSRKLDCMGAILNPSLFESDIENPKGNRFEAMR